jgi:hypothetical protein
MGLAGFMFSRIVVCFSLFTAAALAGDVAVNAVATPDPPRTWTVSLQGGFANSLQLMLGGTYGEGPFWQNRLTLSMNNALTKGDTVSLFGWSTTDLPSVTPNWQTGMLYRTRLVHRRNHTLYLGGGVQRWILPQVKTGAQDWLISGSLNYTTAIGRLPIIVNQDSLSLLRSTLPTGSLLYTQILTQHALLKRDGFQMLVRHGVHHGYGWGFYGGEGNRVVRYSAALVMSWKNTTIEAGCRQQFGLQDKVPYNRYWTFLITRQFTGPFRSKG